MRITSLQLKNFKRFTDLKIQSIPEQSKLILLIGSNGSGKSCIFDAFSFINELWAKVGRGRNNDYNTYYRKDPSKEIEIILKTANDEVSYIENKGLVGRIAGSFYGRTSFRQISRLTRTAIGQGGHFDIENDSDRSRYFIDRDKRFENDLDHIMGIILSDLFRREQSSELIRQKYVEPINNSFRAIFGNNDNTRLELIEIIPPLEGKIARITFRKGRSEIHYNLLSAGEKEVFNLLFNLMSRWPLFKDAVFYFDELDIHLNTKLQFKLIKEITENWIPENSQIWTASHSLGFIEYARQSEQASIIDFDEINFDVPIELNPSKQEDQDIYEIAIGKEFLPSLFEGKDICFVENKDKEFFASLAFPQMVFVSATNRNDVFHKIKGSNEYKGIVDRDFLSDDDLVKIRKHYPQLYVLGYYCVENYLYHPDNLVEYYRDNGSKFDKLTYINHIIEYKNKEFDQLVVKIVSVRCGYPFFKEPKYNGNSLQDRFKNKGDNEQQAVEISNCLKSNVFEEFYKVYSMKGKNYNVNIPKRELSKTNWFKNCISSILGY